MNQFEIQVEDVVAILQNTPSALTNMLTNLPEKWTTVTEGGETWSPYDVIGHLIHGERTNWIPRVKHILSGNLDEFPTFDRLAQFAEAPAPLNERLATFAEVRQISIEELKRMNLSPKDYLRVGRHSAFGEVNLGQLLATWAVHDLDHITQITRTMAKAYTHAVGPWAVFLSTLHDRTENSR